MSEKNLIPKIAELLGVEIGEEFEVMPECAGPNYKSSRYRFSEHGLEYSNYIHYPSETGWSPTDTITGLLNGRIRIIKLPFEPKEEEHYWCVCWNSYEIGSTYCVWLGSVGNYMDKYCNNVFRNQDEAEAHKFEIYEKLTGKKWKE